MRTTLAAPRSFGYAVDVVTTLIGRELKMRYKGSWLGLFWAVLSPLGIVVVLHVLFTTMLPLNIPHYAAFVYCGLLPWTWFQSAVLSSATTLVDNRDLVRKPFFPRLLLPVTITCTNFVLYILALPVLLVLLLVEGVPLSATLLLLPLIWLVQAIFVLACTILVAAVSVVVRDVQHLLNIGMLLWFYLTPIFYDLNRVDPAQVHWLLYNPMTGLVQAHRALALTGQLPHWEALAISTLSSVALLAVSVAIFRALENTFVEEV